MIESTRFRAAMGGFNRSDVVSYIETLSMEHQKELRKAQDEAKRLETEKQALSQELEAAKEELATVREQDEALQEQVTSLAQEATDAVERCRLAEAQLQALNPPQEDDEADAGEDEEPELPLCNQELMAYRRAEQTERFAIHRANHIYRRIADLTDSARTRYLDSGEDIAALAEDLKSGLARMEDALSELQAIFEDTSNAFESMDLPNVSDTDMEDADEKSAYGTCSI